MLVKVKLFIVGIVVVLIVDYIHWDKDLNVV